MQLSTYLQKHDVTAAEFAARIGVKRQSVWRYMSGERLPHREVMHRIEQATSGEVTPADFFTSSAKKETAA